MPIRQGGILASRASTWPRDHFCRSTMAPRASWPTMERVLADIDADHGDRGIGCLRHGVLLVFGAPCQLRLLAGDLYWPDISLIGDTSPTTAILTSSWEVFSPPGSNYSAWVRRPTPLADRFHR